MAADSRQVVESPSGQWRVDSEHAQKIFQLNPYVGVAILGQGTFYTDRQTSPKSIRFILRSVARELPQPCTVEAAATLLHARVGSLQKIHTTILAAEQTGLSFYVGGYGGPEASCGELYRCDIPGEISLERTTEDAGLVWGGQREIVDRLIQGCDPRIFQFLSNEIARNDFAKQRARLQFLINFQTMPLHDAVDLTTLLVRNTIEMQRFSDGVVGMPGYSAACGGTIRAAIITPDEGFHWVKYHPSKFEVV